MKNKLLSEGEVVKALTDFLTNTDADSLATLVGYVFGGECFAVDEGDATGYDWSNGNIIYSFTPNDLYMGEFGELSEFEGDK